MIQAAIITLTIAVALYALSLVIYASEHKKRGVEGE